MFLKINYLLETENNNFKNQIANNTLFLTLGTLGTFGTLSTYQLYLL